MCGGRRGYASGVITLLLFLVLLYVALGIIGVVVHGLFWLFVVAVVLFLVSAVGGGYASGRRRRRGPLR